MRGRPVRGLALVTVLALTALEGSQFLLLPSVALLLPRRRWLRDAYRRWTSVICYMWLGLASGLMERLGGVRVVVSTDDGRELPYGERALLVANHRCRIDWMFLWSFAARYGMLSSYRVILKAPIKAVPWFGWAMQNFLFIFIERGQHNRAADLARIQAITRYLAHDCPGVPPNTIVLFPEGTDLSVENQEKDAKFASEHGLASYEQVLHPRALGFLTALRAARGSIDALYDITMSYVDFEPAERPSEASIVQGRLPRQVNIHVKRHPVASLPHTPEALERLLNESFAEKDRVLRQFYKSESSRTCTDCNAQSTNQHRATQAFRVACLWWMGVGGAMAYAAHAWPWWFWGYVLVSATVCAAVTSRLGGFDSIELRLFSSSIEKKD